MKKQLFFVGLMMFFSSFAKAQTVRTQVLVIGNGNTALAAAMQSAISGVKTTILLEAGGFDIASINEDLSSGIQATFSKKYKEFTKTKDNPPVLTIDKQQANAMIMKWVDSVKNLTVIKNSTWTKADRSGQHWSFKLSDGKTLKPAVLVNTGSEKLNAALKVIGATANKWQKLDYTNTIYRTSVSAGASISGTTANLFSLYQFFVPEQENFIWISDQNSMLLGQAGGATAAYAAFFDTKTSLSNLKKIQGELINYKLNQLPFGDIKATDTNWKAIQFVGLSGVIKADLTNMGANFSPEKLVNTVEIKQPIKDLFYKAQIWFDDYKDSKMTIGSTIDMVCYVGNKAVEATKKDIEKKWKTTYQFKSDFDLTRQINRREFSVLLQDYMPPFNVNVDKTGRVVR